MIIIAKSASNGFTAKKFLTVKLLSNHSFINEVKTKVENKTFVLK